MKRDKIVIRGWVARDGEQPNGDKPGICWYSREPRRMKDWPQFTVSHPLDNWVKLPDNAFPFLAWENGPMEVEMTIRPYRGLNEFETELADIVHSWGTPDESPFNALGELREDAARLLAIAREMLDSEKSEIPTNLDEEIKRFFNECIEVYEAKINGVDERVIEVSCYELTARHFAKWASEHLVKPAEWSYPYGKNETVDQLIAIAECLEMDGDCSFNGYKGEDCGKFLRELARRESENKPAEWSEEDEKIRGNLMSLLANMRGDRITEETYQKYYPWLKSLRPTWKPSEEQMEALKETIDIAPDTYKQRCTLVCLYNDLKTKL